MVTIIFAIVAVICIAAALLWWRSWNKDDEPKVNVGGSAALEVNHENAPAEVLQVKATDDVLFGRDGVLKKGTTFYEGKIPKNSQLYIRLSVLMRNSAVFCGINDNVARPKMQIAVQYDTDYTAHRIGNPSNSKRQSVEPYMIHNGESIWVSSDILNGVDLPEWFVLRIFWRVDNGLGYGAWQVSDAINIHNK